jgi:hypothetical protein
MVASDVAVVIDACAPVQVDGNTTTALGGHDLMTARIVLQASSTRHDYAASGGIAPVDGCIARRTGLTRRGEFVKGDSSGLLCLRPRVIPRSTGEAGI